MGRRILVVDAFAGVAGDMMVAALLDLGGDLGQLQAQLRALPVEGYRVEAQRVMRGPFAATAFSVLPEGEPRLRAAPVPEAPRFRPGGPASPLAPVGQDHGHSHDHGHGHDHGHSHDHGRDPDPAAWVMGAAAHPEPSFPGQPHRPYREIRAAISAAPLPARAKERALSAFARLAAAEARVHGSDVETVIFHEVGGVDAIVDIVSVALLLEQLEVDELVGGPLPMGRGMTGSAHGRIPLPAPATLFCLEGWPLAPGIDGVEQVTPTGAAILAGMARPGPIPSLRLIGVGHGAGRWDPPTHPNLVRLLLGEKIFAESAEQVDVLVAQMDDLQGEHLPPLIEALLAAGALDVTAAPVLMKKGRQGMRVEVLVEPAQRVAVERTMLRHGSTFGLRRTRAERTVLERRHAPVETPYGTVRLKLGLLDGEVVQVAPEFEDVRAVALAARVPVPWVHQAALRAWDPEESG